MSPSAQEGALSALTNGVEIGFKGHTSDEGWMRPEEFVGLLFFLLLLVMSMAHRVPVFEPMRRSRLTYFTAVLFVLMLLGYTGWHFVNNRFLRREGERIQNATFFNRLFGVVRDWLPAVICLGIYESLKHLHLNEIIFWLGITPKDHWMIRADEFLVGFHASVALEHIISDTMTWYMRMVYYYGYYLYPAIVGVFLYLWRPRRAFRELVVAFLACAFIGYAIYILVPVAGPRLSHIQYQYTIPLSASGTLETMQMDTLRYQYDCFPSLHTAIPLTVLVVAYRHSWKLAIVLTPFVLSTVFSTLYLRMHYLIDVVAGIALVPFCVFLGIKVDGWWCKIHRRAIRGMSTKLGWVFHSLLGLVATLWLVSLIR